MAFSIRQLISPGVGCSVLVSMVSSQWSGKHDGFQSMPWSGITWNIVLHNITQYKYAIVSSQWSVDS